MERIYLSETEKALLLSLNSGNGFKLKGINEKEIGLAANKLKDFGFIKAIVNYNNIIDAEILTKGEVYIKENQGLENPVDENELKRLQKESLEYQSKIRDKEEIIRNLEIKLKRFELIQKWKWLIGLLIFIVGFVLANLNLLQTLIQQI
nr:hypothetical protein [uncultured Draconibacterium sp.]